MARIVSAHLGYLFTELPLPERFAAAKRCGFGAVEHPAPYALGAEDGARLVREAGLPFVQCALPSGDAAKNEKGFACFADQGDRFRASVTDGMAMARALGCRMLHAMAGVVPAGVDRETLWPAYLTHMREAADRLAEAGLTLLIEPIGAATIAGYLIDHPDAGLRALDAVGRPNVALLFDAFHAENAGVDAVAFTRAHGRRFAHVHIADIPGRHEPGTGRFDFAGFYGALDEAGYRGAIGCEYVPAGRTEDGLGWLGG